MIQAHRGHPLDLGKVRRMSLQLSLPKPNIHTEINLDELPYDPDDRMRILEYTRNPKKQDEGRRKYLTRGPYRPSSNFDYPQGEIGDTQWRFNPDC